MKSKLKERVLVGLVAEGILSIRADGTIWREKYRGKKCNPRQIDRPLGNGYLAVRVRLGGVYLSALSHRLVWQHFHGDIPEGLCINHKNGIKSDNRPDNLEVVSHSENVQHAIRNGLRPIGVFGLENGYGKLSDAQVIEIRRRRLEGELLASLASEFRVCFQHISSICNGRKRAYVREELARDWKPHKKEGRLHG